MSKIILGQTHAEVVAVGVTPVKLDGGPNRPTGARKSILIGNGSAQVFLGGANVTTANGFPLAAGAQMAFDATHGALYAVAAAPATVNILEGY